MAGCDSAHAAQQFHVLRAMVEVVVADETAVGLAAELAVLFFVDLLEDRTLVPRGALVALEGAAQLALREIHGMASPNISGK